MTKYYFCELVDKEYVSCVEVFGTFVAAREKFMKWSQSKNMVVSLIANKCESNEKVVLTRKAHAHWKKLDAKTH